MSDSTQVLLRIAPEVTYDTLATTAWEEMRFTAESLMHEAEQAYADEIRYDRNYAHIMRVAERGTGQLDFILSHASYDTLIAAVMCGSFSAQGAVVTAETDVSAANADDSFNQTTGDWSSTLSAGQWIQTSGFATAGNNGIFKVVSVTATKIVVGGGASIVNEAAGPAVTITRLARCLNSKTKRSFDAEAEWKDLTNKYKQALGFVVQSMQLNLAAGAPITGSFSMTGARVITATTAATGSPSSPNANPPMTAGGNVLSVYQGYTSINALRGSVSMSNAILMEDKLGSLRPVGFNLGMFQASGDLEMYFKDHTQLDLFLANTETSIAIVLQGLSSAGATVAYVLDFPAVKFARGEQIGGGINQHVVQRMPWQAFLKSAESITCGIHRLS